MEEKLVVGVFEKIDFPEFGIKGMSAKVDTGAYKGAFHCTKVSVDKSGKKPVLHFSPFDHPEKVIKTTDFARRPTTSSNGHTEMRYVINTTVKIKGKIFPIMISLADRSTMKWQVLIGRRFLRQNNITVDPNLTKRLKV